MLGARFHVLRDRSLAAVDRVFAEPIQVAFLSGNAVDPSRGPAIQIEAVLRVGEGKSTVAQGGVARAWRSRITAQRGELHIDRAKYPDLIVRSKDKIRALSRQGEPWFEVLAVDDRSATRMVLQLGEA